MAQSFVGEDLTCLGATKSGGHTAEPTHHHKRSHHNEKPVHCNEEQPSFSTTGEKPVQQ